MNDLFQQPDRDYLSDLVGEGKKFADTQSLARGKAEADAYIETLKRQMDELRQDYTRLDAESKARASIEELLNRKQTPEDEPVRPASPPKQPDPDIGSIFDERIRAHEERKRADENLAIVKDRLVERFGSDYQNKLNQAVDNTGLDKSFMNDMARRSPEAFLKLLGVEQTPQPFTAPPRSTSQAPLNRQPAPRERTLSYYKELKRTNPSEYRSPKINVQMHQDAQRLGAAFFDDGMTAGKWDKNYNRYEGPNAIVRQEDVFI
jgi:hypothetical protein